jgi:oligoendopeptidase F
MPQFPEMETVSVFVFFDWARQEVMDSTKKAAIIDFNDFIFINFNYCISDYTQALAHEKGHNYACKL